MIKTILIISFFSFHDSPLYKESIEENSKKDYLLIDNTIQANRKRGKKQRGRRRGGGGLR